MVEALARHVEAAPPEGPVVVLADTDPGAARLFEDLGVPVGWWSRRVAPGAQVGPWPPTGPPGATTGGSPTAWTRAAETAAWTGWYGPTGSGEGWRTAALRLPRDKDELEMLVHAAASVLEPGGAFLVYGANDEGVRSAASRIEPVFGAVRTVAVKRRCRVLRARRPEAVPELRGELPEWRSTWRLEVEGRGEAGEGKRIDRPWVSYPGVFSHGRLDAGTRLLLEVTEPLRDGAEILDYGCGSGVVGGVVATRSDGIRPHLLDADAIALAAARENVAAARTILADGLHALEDLDDLRSDDLEDRGVRPPGSGEPARAPRFDLIVSNPPYHSGKPEDRRVMNDLVREAPGYLLPDGALEMVVQRRFAVEALLNGSFRRVRVLGEDATYRVWRGERPRAREGR